MASGDAEAEARWMVLGVVGGTLASLRPYISAAASTLKPLNVSPTVMRQRTL